jgi:hypothetical protein
VNESAPDAAAPAARDRRWEDAFWQSRRPAASAGRKRQVHWFEQIELWEEDRPANLEISIGAPLPRSEPAGARIREMPAALHASVESEAEADAHKTHHRPFNAPRHAVRMEDIAKLLHVNRAVDGVDVELHRFNLPHRAFAARFSLWKGSPAGTPFLMGC